MSTTIQINYLGCDQGQPGPAGTYIEYPADLPAGIRVGWADREGECGDRTVGRPAVYGEIDGISAAVSDSGMRLQKRFGSDLYPYLDSAGNVPLTEANAPEWVAHLPAIRALVIQRIAEDRAARPEIEAACAGYEAILASIDREYAEHDRMWRDVWLPQIARAFRRKTVVLGEQTVPGMVVVRSARGKVLGYAKCWDGRYLGQVVRV